MRFESNSSILVYYTKPVKELLAKQADHRSASIFSIDIKLKLTFSGLSMVVIWVRIILDYFFSLMYYLGNINFVQSSTQKHRSFNHFTIADSHNRETGNNGPKLPTLRLRGFVGSGRWSNSSCEPAKTLVSTKSHESRKTSDQGPVSRKPRKFFGPAKPFLVICILKTEKCIDLKFCMKGTSVHIKDIMELNSSVIIRFEILLWLSGCENVSGPSRNGPQE